MKLRDWLKKAGIKQTEFADRIGLSQASVSRIVAGKLMPRRDMVRRIEKETKGKVKLEDYYDDEKKEGPAASVAPFLAMDNLVSACG